MLKNAFSVENRRINLDPKILEEPFDCRGISLGIATFALSIHLTNRVCDIGLADFITLLFRLLF